LEQENRRWKVICISALIVLILVIIGGGVVGLVTTSFYTHRLREAQLRTEVEAMRAQEALEQARQAAARQAEKGAK